VLHRVKERQKFMEFAFELYAPGGHKKLKMSSIGGVTLQRAQRRLLSRSSRTKRNNRPTA